MSFTDAYEEEIFELKKKLKSVKDLVEKWKKLKAPWDFDDNARNSWRLANDQRILE